MEKTAVAGSAGNATSGALFRGGNSSSTGKKHWASQSVRLGRMRIENKRAKVSARQNKHLPILFFFPSCVCPCFFFLIPNFTFFLLLPLLPPVCCCVVFVSLVAAIIIRERKRENVCLQTLSFFSFPSFLFLSVRFCSVG